MTSAKIAPPTHPLVVHYDTGASFEKIHDGYYRGAYGMTWSAPRWRCTTCGRIGYGATDHPYQWAESCARGHLPCDYCGQMLAVTQAGNPRVHTHCPERRRNHTRSNP